MEVSFFSFLMAVLWSSLFFCVLALLQKSLFFIRQFGIATIFVIYLGCILRFLLPVEFTFTKVVSGSALYANAYRLFCLDKITLGAFEVSVLGILGCISVLITLILTLRFFRHYFSFLRKVSVVEPMRDSGQRQLTRILERLSSYRQYDDRVEIFYSPRVSVPIGIGLKKKKILLPELEYTDTELYYILLHEFTHFSNKDLYLKMAVTFLCNLFWWNPFVYLLRRKLDEILEFKCDLTVVANMDNVEKACYLSTILSSLERTPDSLTPLRRLPNACLVAPSKKELLKKRFLLVAAPTKARTTIQNQIIRFLYIALAVVTLTGSYAFILQPKYETPKDKIITTLNTYESTPENTWLIQDMEGRYFLCNSYDKEAKELSYETAQMMLENGFIIKENGSR